jgi:hypothetical protein
MPGYEGKNLYCNLQCITHAPAFVTVVGSFTALNPQHPSALAAPVPVVSHYIKAVQAEYALGLLCQPLSFASRSVTLARFCVAVNTLARRTSNT